jgi:uncharacterized protein YjbJ (UPF0337 family)
MSLPSSDHVLPSKRASETRLALPAEGHHGKADNRKGASVDKDRIEGKAKETEGEVQQKWGEAKDKARDTWEDVKDKGEDVVDRGEDRIDERDEENTPASSR